jgi:hypothetical protein
MLNTNSTRPAANNSNGRPASSHETGICNPKQLIPDDSRHESLICNGNDERLRLLLDGFGRDGVIQPLNEIRLSYLKMAYYLNELDRSFGAGIAVHPHRDTVDHLFLLEELINYFNEVEA